MSNNLPLEILTIIGSHLSQEDLSACIATCQPWKKALIPILYKSVMFRSNVALNDFVHTLHNSPKHGRLGDHVRQLRLDFYSGPEAGLFDLVKLCPYVTEFEMKHSTLTELFAPYLKEWKHLERLDVLLSLHSIPESWLDGLQHTIVRLSLTIEEDLAILDIIPSFTRLEELRIMCNPELPLSALEKIHNNLPHLSILNLGYCQFRGPMPESVEPCNSVRTLKFGPMNVLCWPEYFASKYKNVEMIDFRRVQIVGDLETEAFHRFLRSCRNLKRLRMVDFNDHNFYRKSLDVLVEIGAPLTFLNLYYPPIRLAKTAVTDFQNTLRSIDFSWRGVQATLEYVLKPLRTCKSLEELSLRYGHTFDIEIDRILAACRNLKNLTLSGGHIDLSRHYDEFSTVNRKRERICHRQLRELSLKATDIADDVFPYLARFTSQLARISYAFKQPPDRNILIEFPNPSLRHLIIECGSEACRVYKLQQTTELNHYGHERLDEIFYLNDRAQWFQQCHGHVSEVRKMKTFGTYVTTIRSFALKKLTLGDTNFYCERDNV
ncbi:hypothetical protein EC973_005131 [Apophysomyces ossiformis]|uniref:F-box domain-containing protein n=1 Tax=Apophysomyces ossiformis TaxID=679940 RepID=A0A8H7EL47_9FUNG|nr:hypothetical protein EC973_005131 [Apophysomyces ossiformis]